MKIKIEIHSERTLTRLWILDFRTEENLKKKREMALCSLERCGQRLYSADLDFLLQNAVNGSSSGLGPLLSCLVKTRNREYKSES